MARRRRQRERIALPWERRHGRLRGVVGRTRWQAIVAGLFSAALLVGFARYAENRVRMRNTRVAIAHVKQAIDRFRADVGRCPTSNAELVHPPLSQKHYLDTVPSDGWNQPLHVRCPGHFGDEADVISAGPSGSLLQDDNIQ